MASDFVYVHAGPEHRPFLIKTAMKAMRLAPEFEDLTDDAYYEWAKPHVAELVLNNPSLVALEPDDLDTIISFLTYSDNTQIFAYTRKGFRGFGIYGRLKEISGVEGYSHRSRTWKHSRGGLVYRPWFCGPVGAF